MSCTYLNICRKWSNDFLIIARVGIIMLTREPIKKFKAKKKRTIETWQKLHFILHQLKVPNLFSQKKAIIKFSSPLRSKMFVIFHELLDVTIASR